MVDIKLGLVIVFVVAIISWYLSKRCMVKKLEEAMKEQVQLKESFYLQEKLYMEELLKIEQAYNNSIRNFRHEVSHSVRMPISIITGYAGLLHKGIADEVEQKTYLFKVCEQAEDINKLLTKTLRDSDPTKNNTDIVLEREQVNVSKLLKDIIVHLSYLAEQAKIEIRLSMAEKDIILPLDSILIKKVFYNLLENSLKYMKVLGEIRITVAELEDGKCLIIWKDNGVGMAKDELEHIFETKYRGSGNDQIKGNGLGLTIVKNIIEQQGGTISAKSTMGVDMTFYITLGGDKKHQTFL